MLPRVRSIVWMSDTLSGPLRSLLSSEITIVRSAQEWLAAERDAKTVTFVDNTTLTSLDQVASLPRADQLASPGPVIVVCDDTLQTAIAWLPARAWLSNVVSTTTLQLPSAAEHIGNVMRTLTHTGAPRLLDWLGSTVIGRRVRLAHASRRVERLDRMTTFFDGKGVGGRTIELLRDAAEELLTNAFYDAPVAAGALSQPISRTQDVSLSDDSACDMVYGCRDDLAVVRVRDPFGSLARGRLIEVLMRCARTDMAVEVDETMGGAGLGLWRIFTAASFVALAVVQNRYTEFLVGIGKRLPARPKPFAFHLFFKDHPRARRWRLLDADSTKPNVNKSVTIVTK